MTPQGLLLTLEGVDGSGKTTQLQRLAARLTACGREPVLAQEPGGTAIGLAIRRILLDRANSALNPRAELLLYFASRAQNIAEIIRPALAAGRIVIADRFTDATVAYQGYGRRLGAETVRSVEQVACGGLQPDLTLWLDIDPRAGVRRALERSDELDSSNADETRMERENAEFFERVRQGYAEIHKAEPERIAHIDASGTRDQVAQAVWSAVEPRLNMES